jgi:hypothetical protein
VTALAAARVRLVAALAAVEAGTPGALAEAQAARLDLEATEAAS